MRSAANLKPCLQNLVTRLLTSSQNPTNVLLIEQNLASCLIQIPILCVSGI